MDLVVKTWSEVLAIAEGRDRPQHDGLQEFVCRLRLCLGLQPRYRWPGLTNLERAEALWVQLSANQRATLRAKYMRPAALE